MGSCLSNTPSSPRRQSRGPSGFGGFPLVPVPSAPPGSLAKCSPAQPHSSPRTFASMGSPSGSHPCAASRWRLSGGSSGFMVGDMMQIVLKPLYGNDRPRGNPRERHVSSARPHAHRYRRRRSRTARSPPSRCIESSGRRSSGRALSGVGGKLCTTQNPSRMESTSSWQSTTCIKIDVCREAYSVPK